MRDLTFFSLLLMGLSSCMIPASASMAKDDAKATSIQVQVGKVTEAVFPSKVSKVIKGGVPDSVLVEVLDNSVYLLPKTDHPSDIFVTTVSGSSYPLDLHIGTDHDIKVQVGSFNNEQISSSRGFYMDEMDLMKDLLLHKEPAGATRLPASGKAFLSNKEIELAVDQAYELGQWKAYVLIARNLIDNAVIIPVEQISLPDLLAVSADRDMLAARGQEGDRARVYIIMGQ